MLKTKSGTLIKSMYMIPGIICCILLAGSGVNIYLDDASVVTTMSNSTYEVLDNTNAIVILNSTVNETVTSQPHAFVLQNPVWVSLHYLFALILAAYVFTQVLRMLTSKD